MSAAAEKDPIDWREANGTTYLGRFDSLFVIGIFSDFEFVVGQGRERIKAHKLVLMVGSPIFEAILTGDPTMQEMVIPDFEPKIFKEFLQFLYTGACSNSLESPIVVPLLKTASTYKVPDLGQFCGELIERDLNETTALIIFQQAVEFEEKSLEEKAVQHICKFAFRIVETDEFLKLKTKHLEKLVGKDDLAVYNEIQLFEALVRWAAEECRRQGTVLTPKYSRSFLETVIPKIRFPQMLPSEFSRKVAPLEILLTEEVVSVLLYYNIPAAERSLAPSNTKFNSSPREYYLCPTNWTLQRLKEPFGTIELTNTWHRICFKVDTPMWPTSVGLNKAAERPVPVYDYDDDENGWPVTPAPWSDPDPTLSSYMVEVRLEDFSLDSIYAKKRETVLKKSNSSGHYQIMFEKPVKILPSTWYTASLRVEGNYVGQNYKNHEEMIEIHLPESVNKSKLNLRMRRKLIWIMLLASVLDKWLHWDFTFLHELISFCSSMAFILHFSKCFSSSEMNQ